MTPAPIIARTMRRALEDPNLLGRQLVGDSWLAWRVLLIALMGESLTEDERILFARLTGRSHEPMERVEEFFGLAGRRGGKSRAMAVLIVYLATLVDYGAALTVGERPIVLCLGQTSRQAAVVYNYVVGIIEATPLLAGLIRTRSFETLSLTNGVDIEIRAASFRGLRGVTCVAVCCDELCFWYSDEAGAANPDSAILAAVRPSLATTGGPLIAISTPYAKRGVAYEAWRDNFGEKGDPLILVAQGATRDFNPSFPQRKVDRELARDPVAAPSEYLGLWRSDLEALLTREAIEGATVPGRIELPPIPGQKYWAFVDPSGGSVDSMTLGIAHAEDAVAVLDLVREVRPPFSPDDTVAEFVALMGRYHCNEVTGDRWGGVFCQDQFKSRGVEYRVSERTKSQIYQELLPLLNSKRVELLDVARLHAQLAGLERRTARGGRDSIDHPRGSFDDVANSAAGALVLASGIGSDGFNLEVWMQAWVPGYPQPVQ